MYSTTRGVMALNILDMGSCWARLLNLFGISNYDEATNPRLRPYYELAAGRLQTALKKTGSETGKWPSWQDRCGLFYNKVSSGEFYSAIGRMFDIDETSSVVSLFQHKAIDKGAPGFASKYAISDACYEAIVKQLGINPKDGFDMELLLKQSGMTKDAAGLCSALTELPVDPYTVTGSPDTGFVTRIPSNLEMCDLIKAGTGIGLVYHLEGTSLRLDELADYDWSEMQSLLQEKNMVTGASDKNLVTGNVTNKREAVNFYSTYDLVCLFGLVGVVIIPYRTPSDKNPNGKPGILGIAGGVDIKTWLACNALKQQYAAESQG